MTEKIKPPNYTHVNNCGMCAHYTRDKKGLMFCERYIHAKIHVLGVCSDYVMADDVRPFIEAILARINDG